MNIYTKDEKLRRNINFDTDSEPSIVHKITYSRIKKHLVNKIVLDIGCWSGQFEKLAISDVKKIVGIDPGKNAINVSRRYFSNSNKATFKVGSAEKLVFPDNYFDTVVMFEVLEHLPKNTELTGLGEIRRVLKKGGILIVTTPYNSLFSILLDPAYFLIGHRHYSIKTITKLLSLSGFKIQNINLRGGFIHLLAANLNLVYKHIFRKKFNYNKKINILISREFHNKGFANLMVIAKKII